MKQFRTEIEIDAPVARAWTVLTGFHDYPDWNPTIRAVDGTPAPGSKLRLRLAREIGGEQTIGVSARVRVCEPNRELAWGGGIPGAPWLLDVHHYFRLEEIAGEHARLIHGEDFRGILVPLIWPLIASRVGPGYEATNQAFKRQCERH